MQNKSYQFERELAERLSGVGQHLQAIRQEHGLSLDDVAIKTLIPTRILKALEAGDLKQLPEPVYIQGFIRRYAEAVGMKPADFAIADNPIGSSDQPKRQPGQFSTSPQLRPLHLYFVYTAVVVAAISGLSNLLTQPSYQQKLGLTAAPIAITNSGVVSLSPTAKPVKPQSTQSAGRSPETTSDKPVRIGVTLVSQSWLRVVVDGKTDFEGVLSEGTQRLWEADRQITLRAGNAGGVVVNLNNGTAKPLGEPGSIKEVTFGTSSESATLPDSNEGG